MRRLWGAGESQPPRLWLLSSKKVTPAQRQILYKHIKVVVVYIIIIKNKLIAVYNCKDSSQAKPVQNDRWATTGRPYEIIV